MNDQSVSTTKYDNNEIKYFEIYHIYSTPKTAY